MMAYEPEIQYRCIQTTGKKRRRRCSRPGTVWVFNDPDLEERAGKMCDLHAAKLPEGG